MIIKKNFFIIKKGKTLQALGIALYYKDEWPLLIITPSSLRVQWAEVKFFQLFNIYFFSKLRNGFLIYTKMILILLWQVIIIIIYIKKFTVNKRKMFM